MIFSSDRGALRRMYRDAWSKHRDGAALSPLEQQIADVIAKHPEYHPAVEAADEDRDYTPEKGDTNPFLHMGLHLGLGEQVATDRPPGIRALYARIVAQSGDVHTAEHRMIECLAETLWEAQANNRPPDDAAYRERLERLASRRV